MIRVPVTIVATQWALVVALAGLVIVMYRQLAHLLALRQATSTEAGLPLGVTAPEFAYRLVKAGSSATLEVFRPDGLPTLLVFSDPACAHCEDGLVALEQVSRQLDSGPVRILVVTDAEDVLILAVDAFRLTLLPLARVEPGTDYRLFKTSITPFAFGIDAAGIVRSKGAADSEARIRELLRPLLSTEPITPSLESKTASQSQGG